MGKEQKPGDRQPLVWALLGEKAGDNAQVRTLAHALDCAVVEKRLSLRRLHLLPNLLLGATPLALQRKSRRLIVPPWPDAIVASGQRSVPVALWVKHLQGGNTRLIHIGRPRAPLSWFDLIVTTPQYGLPTRLNVVHLDLPLHAQDSALLERSASAWRDRLPPGPRRIALFVGGDMPPYRFDAESIEVLAAGVMRQCLDQDAKLVVTCGRRLPTARSDQLQQLTAEGCELFHTMHGGGDNPYSAFLRIANAFVVTTDSVSMMCEAVTTGRPVQLFAPPYRPSPWWRISTAAGTLLDALTPRLVRDALVAGGIRVPQRQTIRVAEALVSARRARWLGKPYASTGIPVAEVVAHSSAGCSGTWHATLLHRARDLVHAAVAETNNARID